MEPDSDIIQRLLSISDGARIHDARCIVGLIRSEHYRLSRWENNPKWTEAEVQECRDRIVYFRIMAGEFLCGRTYTESKRNARKLLNIPEESS